MSLQATGNKIAPEHLVRTAMVYLRQSSPGQVKHNLESQRLQYALAERAKALGFARVRTIDCDLGVSAAVGSRRLGFEQLLAAVAMGDVGAVFSRELSRLSRTDKDWCHLVELCQLFNTLIGDEETVYDANNIDDQLVLGIKGTLSVAELNVLRMRMQRGKEAKAKRGEFYCLVAPGYVRDGAQLVKDPNRRVQEAIALVFAKFLELGSVRQTYRWFLDNRIEVPTNKTVAGTTTLSWQLPAQTFIPSILHHPIYAGAYAYGRRSVEKVIEQGRIRKRQHAIKSPTEVKVLIKDHHEGYIDWHTFERVQKMIEQNGTNFEADDATLTARQGAGLLSGLLRCARCGHKLHVRYWGRAGTTPRYLCHGGYQGGGRYCIGFGGARVDQCIGDAVCGVLAPQGIAASLHAVDQLDTQHDAHLQALKRQLQQAQYEAQRAFAQYDHVDPNNRLVADTLELRWNQKLEHIATLEQTLHAAQEQQRTLTDEQRGAILALGERFAIVWNDPHADPALKKRLVRTLIKEVIADIDEAQQHLTLIIHWQGGAHTKFTLPRPLPANRLHKTADEDRELIKKMAVRYSDAEIAQVLSKHGRKTGKGHRWTQSSVRIIRRKFGIKSAPAKDPEILNMTQAQDYVGVSDSTLLRLIEHKLLPANQVAQHAPYEIRKADLDREPVARILNTLKTTGKLILQGDPLGNQQSLFT
jgi:DNA invertase Pin-like site-specific DNA recombinase